MNQMGLMGGMPPEGMPQPGGAGGLPPEGAPPEGMPPEGMPQEGMPPGGMEGQGQPSQPVPDLSEEEMQRMYQMAYGEMSILLDQEETFRSTRKMLSEAGEMLPEQFGMMIMGVIGRLEQDVGPLPFEVLELLVEHLFEESEDRWGVKFEGNEQDRAGAAFFGLYFQSHPDRVPWDQEEIEEMLAEEFGDDVPEEGMPMEGEVPMEGGMPMQGGMPEEEMY